MAFKFSDISRNLPKKGFVEDKSSHHPYYYFHRDGKKTRFYTYVSHGKPNVDVGDGIVRSMKSQLGLNTMQQVRDLVECRLDRDGYEAALIATGALPRPPSNDPAGLPAAKNKTTDKP